MKFTKLLAAFALCFLTAFSFIACGGKELKETAYGVVHNVYVGKATVTVKNNSITSVSIDEVDLPAGWAKISVIDTQILSSDIATNETYSGSETNLEYAKKISIDGVVFTARNNGTTNSFVDYSNSSKNGSTPLVEWLNIDANAEWYFNAMTSGNYDVLKDDETAYEVTFKNSGTLSKSERWQKSKNDYWPESMGVGLGWAANIKAIEDYIVENGFEDYIAERDDLQKENKNFVINGVNTGATLTDFKDYMDLANSAYNKTK